MMNMPNGLFIHLSYPLSHVYIRYSQPHKLLILQKRSGILDRD
nr:MAG TPA: hypothetical protein [Crassvirales sp.]